MHMSSSVTTCSGSLFGASSGLSASLRWGGTLGSSRWAARLHLMRRRGAFGSLVVAGVCFANRLEKPLQWQVPPRFACSPVSSGMASSEGGGSLSAGGFHEPHHMLKLAFHPVRLARVAGAPLANPAVNRTLRQWASFPSLVTRPSALSLTFRGAQRRLPPRWAPHSPRRNPSPWSHDETIQSVIPSPRSRCAGVAHSC